MTEPEWVEVKPEVCKRCEQHPFPAGRTYARDVIESRPARVA